MYMHFALSIVLTILVIIILISITCLQLQWECLRESSIVKNKRKKTLNLWDIFRTNHTSSSKMKMFHVMLFHDMTFSYNHAFMDEPQSSAQYGPQFNPCHNLLGFCSHCQVARTFELIEVLRGSMGHIKATTINKLCLYHKHDGGNNQASHHKLSVPQAMKRY